MNDDYILNVHIASLYVTCLFCRVRGSVQVYDFTDSQAAKDLPDVCLSTYDEPQASRYNIGLAMPYDTLQ